MPKYTVPDKDTIKKEIMPYLSVAKRGYVSRLFHLKFLAGAKSVPTL